MSIDEFFKVGICTHPLLVGARGMIGNRYVLRQLNGVTVISRRPKKSFSQTAKQKQSRQRFRRATDFAKREMNNPERKEYYKELAVKNQLPNAYTAAIKSYLRGDVRGLCSSLAIGDSASSRPGLREQIHEIKKRLTNSRGPNKRSLKPRNVTYKFNTSYKKRVSMMDSPLDLTVSTVPFNDRDGPL
jgi:hypothetical protein